MNTEKDLRVSVLLDYYSPMLTDKQRDVIDLYYNEDLSLSEIAEHEKITRQGVRDSIKRGEQTLYEMEEKFRLAERSDKFSALIKEIMEVAADIKAECSGGGNPIAITRRADYISELAEKNKELF
ncbi:MAG: putative DNA-binding protein [Oscillospiraceae bacterium]|nr:putative DNA-binding protein [Oscillospiraceae bacterium]